VKNEEIKKEIYPKDAQIRCRWLKVSQVLKSYPLRTTRLYALINSRRVRSFLLKDDPRAVRGIRLVDRQSLDAFFDIEAAKAEEQNPASETPED
jgi:hypothetical protein